MSAIDYLISATEMTYAENARRTGAEGETSEIVISARAELAALRQRVAELEAALDDCRSFAIDGLGVWHRIQPPYIPAEMENYYGIVEIIDDVLKGGAS